VTSGLQDVELGSLVPFLLASRARVHGESTMSETDDMDIFVREIERIRLDHRYSKVMEGIGRLTVAVSYAEFLVDMIGSHLTGDIDAYLLLTDNMSLGVKTIRVLKMCTLITGDGDLKKDAELFCKN
jgi:hypothetical protein